MYPSWQCGKPHRPISKATNLTKVDSRSRGGFRVSRDASPPTNTTPALKPERQSHLRRLVSPIHPGGRDLWIPNASIFFCSPFLQRKLPYAWNLQFSVETIVINSVVDNFNTTHSLVCKHVHAHMNTLQLRTHAHTYTQNEHLRVSTQFLY